MTASCLEGISALNIFQVEEKIIRINKTYDYDLSTDNITVVDSQRVLTGLMSEYIKWNLRRYVETLYETL